MTSSLLALVAAAGIGFLIWAWRARPRRRRDGNPEPHRVYAVRRWLLVFEGIGFLLTGGLGLLASQDGRFVDAFAVALMATTFAPVPVFILVPGVTGGKH